MRWLKRPRRRRSPCVRVWWWGGYRSDSEAKGGAAAHQSIDNRHARHFDRFSVHGGSMGPQLCALGGQHPPSKLQQAAAAAMRRRDGPRIIVPIRPPSSCICVRVSIARLALRMLTPSKTDPHPLSFDPTHPPTGGARAAVGIAVGIVVGGAHSQRRLPLPDHDTAHRASRRAFVPPLPSPRIDTNKASGLNQGVGAAAVGG